MADNTQGYYPQDQNQAQANLAVTGETPDPVVQAVTAPFVDPVQTPTPEVEQAPPDPTRAADGSEIPHNDGATLVSQNPAVPLPDPPTVIDTPLVYQVGTLLTCTTGNWEGTPVSYEYQWQTGGNVVGANQPNYTVTPEMVGYAVTCSVIARNAGGAGVATSDEWYIVSPEAPVLAEAPVASQEDGKLVCSTGTWSGDPTMFNYNWKRDAMTAGAGTQDYVITPHDVGVSFSCDVTAVNANGSKMATSNSVVIKPPVGMEPLPVEPVPDSSEARPL